MHFLPLFRYCVVRVRKNRSLWVYADCGPDMARQHYGLVFYLPLFRFVTEPYVICSFLYYVSNRSCIRYVSVVSCRLVAQLVLYQFPHSCNV